MSSLGARLKRARENKKLTQLASAQLLGITNVQLSRYESNTNSPDPELLVKLADLYDVSTDYLLGTTDDPKPRGMKFRDFKKFLPGQKSESKRDESHTELSDNSSTLEVHPGVGFNSQHSQKVIDFALQQMHREDAYGIDANITMIPVLGTIKAGYDLYAEQQVIGMEPVASQSVSDGAEYFFLVVRGDSMIDEGIREGMRVLVRRQEWVEEGKIGVVILNGDEATLKRVVTRESEIVLLSANAKYPPRIVPISEARIQGQVKQVVWDV